jgi:hypothetical protein
MGRGTRCRAANALGSSSCGTHRVQRALSITVEPALAPVPSLTSVTPNTLNQGSDATMLTFVGTNFVPASFATWKGAGLQTTFVSSTQLSALAPKAILANAGDFSVGVTTPAPGGGASNALQFTVVAVAQNPKPVITSISPTSGNVDDIDTVITVTGSSFIASSKVIVHDTQELATSFTSASELDAILPSSMLSTATSLRVRVNTPAPGGLSDDAIIFKVVGPSNPFLRSRS